MLCNGFGDGLVLIRQHTMNWVIMHMITFPYMMCPEELIPINRHVGPSQPNSQFILLLCLAMITVLLQWQPDMNIWDTWGPKGRKSHCQYHLHITKSQGIIRNGIALNIYIYIYDESQRPQTGSHTYTCIYPTYDPVDVVTEEKTGRVWFSAWWFILSWYETGKFPWLCNVEGIYNNGSVTVCMAMLFSDLIE